MADDTPDSPLNLSPRDITNIAAGSLHDLAVYMRNTWPLDPRVVMAEMARIAQFLERVPLPQVQHGADGAEARPN